MFLVSNRESFSDWLQARLAEQQLSQADLSRISGVHRAIISKILLGASKPTPETLRAIAKGLNLPEEMVYRAAGIMSPVPKSDPLTEEGIHILQQLDPDNKVEALRFLRLRQQVQEEEQAKADARNKKRSGTA